MNNELFDDIVKQNALEREAVVPPGTWNEIVGMNKKKRRPFAWWFLLLPLLIGGSYFIVKRYDNPNYTKQQQAAIDEQKKQKSVSPYNHSTNEDGEPLKNTGSVNNSKDDALKSNSTIPDPQTGIQTGNQTTSNSIVSTTNQIITTDKTNAQNIAAEKKRKNINKNLSNNGAFSTANAITNIVTTNEPSNTYTKKPTGKNTGPQKRVNILQGETGEDNKEDVSPTATSLVNNREIQLLLASLNNFNIPKISLPTHTGIITLQGNPSTVAKKQQTDKKKSSGWKLDASLSAIVPIQDYQKPAYMIRIEDQTHDQTISHSVFTINRIRTKAELSHSFNVGVSKTINKRLTIGAGFSYTNLTERISFSGIDSTTEYRIVKRLHNDGANSYFTSDTLSRLITGSRSIEARNVYHTLSLPISLQYKIAGNNKYSLSLRAGMHLNILMNYKNKTTGKIESFDATGKKMAVQKNSLGADGFAGFRIARLTGKKYEWFAEPGFRYRLSGYASNDLFAGKKYHLFYLSAGIAYSLNK